MRFADCNGTGVQFPTAPFTFDSGDTDWTRAHCCAVFEPPRTCGLACECTLADGQSKRKTCLLPEAAAIRRSRVTTAAQFLAPESTPVILLSRPTGRTNRCRWRRDALGASTRRAADRPLYFLRPARLMADLSTAPRSLANARIIRPQPGGIPKTKTGSNSRRPVACSPKAARRATGNGRTPETGEDSAGNASWPQGLAFPVLA